MSDPHKRYRATVVVVNSEDGRLLLVRDKGKHRFSMPGGGFKYNESTILASVREIVEEVSGLTVMSVERLPHCDFEGRRAHHKVCRVIASGHPQVRQPHEIDKVVWWDMKSELRVQGHVRYILSKIQALQSRLVVGHQTLNLSTQVRVLPLEPTRVRGVAAWIRRLCFG